MSERPILFSTEMVRAILDGRKTQTRRIVKWPVKCKLHAGRRRIIAERDAPKINECYMSSRGHPDESPQCPYGNQGDILWVKETWAEVDTDECPGCPSIAYRASHPDYCVSPWQSPLFMPRHASRITLKIIGIHVERVRDISGPDAFAEGVKCGAWDEDDWVDSDGYLTPIDERHEHAREEFADLWDSINGNKPGCSWTDNPWVWAITFKEVNQ